jgi:hypothetical protein
MKDSLLDVLRRVTRIALRSPIAGRRTRACVAILVAAVAAQRVPAAAVGPQLNPGTLDRTFGTDGKVLTDFRGPISSSSQAVAVQTGGKIVVAGTALDAPGNRFGLAR